MARVERSIVYVYRGPIERGPSYSWHDGYSSATAEGGVLYPWMTRRECEQDARRQGARAVFVSRLDCNRLHAE